MAKVIGPLHSSEARGRCGALVYNTWRGINYAKAMATPETQFSDAQIAIRAMTAACTVAWQALTEAQRAAWYVYANAHPSTSCLASRTRITAYNWFVRIGVRRQLLGGAIGTTPPTFEISHQITDLRYETDPLIIYIVWDYPAAYSPTTLYYEVYRSGPHSSGRYPSIKTATRRGHATYISQFYEDEIPEAGTYTYFVRPIHTTGVVGTWWRILCIGVASK